MFNLHIRDLVCVYASARVCVCVYKYILLVYKNMTYLKLSIIPGWRSPGWTSNMWHSPRDIVSVSCTPAGFHTSVDMISYILAIQRLLSRDLCFHETGSKSLVSSWHSCTMAICLVYKSYCTLETASYVTQSYTVWVKEGVSQET